MHHLTGSFVAGAEYISSFVRMWLFTGGKAVGKRGIERHTTFQKGEGGLPLQTSRVTVGAVVVSGNGTRVGVLSESVVLPPCQQSANGAGKVSDPQWIGGSERVIIAGASLPPIGGGIYHRIATNTGTVGVGEILDPAVTTEAVLKP